MEVKRRARELTEKDISVKKEEKKNFVISFEVTNEYTKDKKEFCVNMTEKGK